MKYREDLPFYLNELNLTGKGVEVGVLRAEFSNLILKNWKGSKLYLVDAWRHIGGLVDVNNPDHNGHLDSYGKAFMNMYPYENRVCIIRELSAEAANLFPDESLDFVYLDAGHDFKSVIADLQAWTPKVKKGGVVSGHDYLDLVPTANFSPDTVFQVKAAVNAFFADKEIKATQEEDFPSWWVIK